MKILPIMRNSEIPFSRLLRHTGSQNLPGFSTARNFIFQLERGYDAPSQRRTNARLGQSFSHGAAFGSLRPHLACTLHFWQMTSAITSIAHVNGLDRTIDVKWQSKFQCR